MYPDQSVTISSGKEVNYSKCQGGRRTCGEQQVSEMQVSEFQSLGDT